MLEVAALNDAVFVAVGDDGTRATEVIHESRRYVVVDSPHRHVRDDARRSELSARTEDLLMALADRVRQGRLVDPAKIGAAADRILRDSGVSRCFSTRITHGVFTWDYDEGAMDYEVSPATFDEHEGDTITEHRFVNVLSSPCSSW